MPDIETIVRVTISKNNRQVARTGFGVPLIMGVSNRFVDLIREYTDPADMLSDGFLVSDPEYKYAQAVSSQAVKPEKFKIGKHTAPIAQISTISVGSVVNTTLYTATLNGVACSYTSDGSATGAEIQAGLIAAINASTQAPYLTATAGSGTDVVVTSDVAGLGFTLALTANLTSVATVANHSITSDIAALQAVDDDWYGLALASKTDADIKQVAGYIETQKKIFAASSSTAGIITTGTTDIAYLLKALNYSRTFLLFSEDTTVGPEAAWLGRILPTDVGQATWKFKTLVGVVSSSTLTNTQIANAQGKNCNVYVTVGGVDITTEGVCADGEYIDIVRGDDALGMTMEENVYQKLIDNDVVPYTNKGIAIAQLGIDETLQEFVDNGFLAPDPKPTSTVPDSNDVSSGDRTARELNGVTFDARHSGAIHKVTIAGFVGF